MVKHPAKYSKQFIPIFADMLKDCNNVIDMFAGVGGIFEIEKYLPDMEISAIELEPEWCNADSRIMQGDALRLPFADSSFDAACTSICYGNRMADTYMGDAKGSKRSTYTIALGRQLSDNNAGKMQWGNTYREFHIKAWNECKRVLKPNGILILNCKNFIRNGREIGVTEWNVRTLESLNFNVLQWERINVHSNGFGANGKLRASFESIIKFQLNK